MEEDFIMEPHKKKSAWLQSFFFVSQSVIFFLWQMRLFILLTVLSFFDERGVAEGLKYTNTWAMQIDANVTEALKIAGKYGFMFKMEV